MIKTVFINLFSPPATRNFPSEQRVVPDGVRGAVEFHGETCTYCSACALKCPTNAIAVDRKAQTLDFDVFRCIVCNCCVEACKKGCVQMEKAYLGPQGKRLIVHFEAPQTEPAEADGEAAPIARPARAPRRPIVAEVATVAAPGEEQSAKSPMEVGTNSAQTEG